MSLTIRAKLVGLALLVSLMMAGPLAVYTLVVERSSQIEDVERGAGATVTLLAEALIDPLYQLRIDQIDRLLGAARSNPELVDIYALDRDGLVLSDGGKDSTMLDQRLPGLDPILAQIRRSPHSVPQREDGSIAVTEPVRSPDGAILGFVHLHLSLRHAEERIAAEWRALAALGGAVFLLGGLLALVLARQFTRPLREVMDATQSIRRGDFSIRIPMGRQDEFGALAQAINGMTEDLHGKTVSKRYLDNIIRSSADTLIVTDTQGRIDIVNPAALALLGYQPEQLLGQPVDQILREEIKITAGNLFSHWETHYRTSMGDLVPVSLSLAALTDETEHLSGFVLAAQDITERKQLEMVLRRSEENLNRAQAVGQIGSWLLNISTNRLEWSAETYRMFGISQQQALDQATFIATIHPEDRDFVMKAWGEAMAGDTPFDIEHRIVVDGQTRWVRERAQIERDAEGRPLTGIGTVQDITERKQTESALKKLSLAVEQSPSSIVITDLNANIEYVNQAFVRETGYSLAEAIGQNPRLLQSGKTPKTAYQEMWACLTRGEIWKGELINRRRDASEYVESVLISPVRQPDGRVTHYLAIKENITERKEFEEELKRSNAELEQFGYAISHDMRQPLRMISSYLQLIEMSLAGQLDGEKRDYFNFAVEGAKRVDQMLMALLEYSRVGRKGEPLDWIESRAVLDEALQFLQPAIAEAQAKLNIAGEWPRILASHDEILRLLQNLIGNATKFRVAGRTPEITVTGKMVKNEWHLCVADNGIGIIPDQIKRLFQVFQRLQLRTAYEGNGVGLALCRKIAEHHKGRIWAESAGEGRGSKFYVVLPVPREEALK